MQFSQIEERTNSIRLNRNKWAYSAFLPSQNWKKQNNKEHTNKNEHKRRLWHIQKWNKFQGHYMTFIEHWQQRRNRFLYVFLQHFFFCELFFVHFLQLRMTLICCVCSSDNVSLSRRTILYYVMALCGVRWSIPIQIIQFVAVRIHRIEQFCT